MNEPIAILQQGRRDPTEAGRMRRLAIIIGSGAAAVALFVRGRRREGVELAPETVTPAPLHLVLGSGAPTSPATKSSDDANFAA